MHKAGHRQILGCFLLPPGTSFAAVALWTMLGGIMLSPLFIVIGYLAQSTVVDAGPLAVLVTRNKETSAFLQRRSDTAQLGTFNISSQTENIQLSSDIVLASLSDDILTNATVFCVDCRTWGVVTFTSEEPVFDTQQLEAILSTASIVATSVVGSAASVVTSVAESIATDITSVAGGILSDVASAAAPLASDISSFLGGLRRDLDASGNTTLESILNATDLSVVASLEGVGGHFSLDIATPAAVSFAIPLIVPSSPAGVSLGAIDNIGLIFRLDMIVTLTSESNFTGGFDVSFPQNASLSFDALNGGITQTNLDGIVVQALPASTFSAAGSVTVALRATAEIGTTLQIPVINQELTMELGAFIEIARYKVVFAPSPNCSMGATESLDLDVGLFAKEAVKLADLAKFRASPTISTVLASTTIGSSCLDTGAPATTSAAVTLSPLENPVVQTFTVDPSQTTVSSFLAGATTVGFDAVTGTVAPMSVTTITALFTITATALLADPTSTDSITIEDMASTIEADIDGLNIIDFSLW